MQAVAYYLEGRGAFHLGARGVGLEETSVSCPADTLFAALCHTLRQTYGEAELLRFLDTYPRPGSDAEGEPALVLSSAFPYAPIHPVGGDAAALGDPVAPKQVLRLWPRPLESPMMSQSLGDDRKKVKRVAWLSDKLFAQWVQGGGLQTEWPSEQGESNLVQGGVIWLGRDDLSLAQGWRDAESDDIAFWAVGDAPRVTVDRVSSASAVYQAGRVRFQPGGGLWFLALWRDEDWRQRGEAALAALGDAGLGGERSAGHGQFRLRRGEAAAPWLGAREGEHIVTLAPYYPRQCELPCAISAKDARYKLDTRRGWMSSPDSTTDGKETHYGMALRRKAVRMIGEGSILRAPDGRGYMGQLADVTPDVFHPSKHPGGHMVWRYGVALVARYGQRAGEARDG